MFIKYINPFTVHGIGKLPIIIGALWWFYVFVISPHVADGRQGL